nr:5184_t:CDS:2 [Entrophospora candida]
MPLMEQCRFSTTPNYRNGIADQIKASLIAILVKNGAITYQNTIYYDNLNTINILSCGHDLNIAIICHNNGLDNTEGDISIYDNNEVERRIVIVIDRSNIDNELLQIL